MEHKRCEIPKRSRIVWHFEAIERLMQTSQVTVPAQFARRCNEGDDEYFADCSDLRTRAE